MATADDWKDNLTFLNPKGFPHEVQGQEILFYAVSPGMLRKMRGMARPLTNALGILFADKSSDAGFSQREQNLRSGEGEPGGSISEIIREAIPVETIRARSDMRERAFDSLLDVFMKEENQESLAAIVFDSCREIFPRESTSKQHKEFLNTISAPDLVSFVIGLAKANLEAFGPLGGAVSEAFSSRLKSALETEAEEDGQDESDPSTTSQESMSSHTPLASLKSQASTLKPAIPFPEKRITPAGL